MEKESVPGTSRENRDEVQEAALALLVAVATHGHDLCFLSASQFPRLASLTS